MSITYSRPGFGGCDSKLRRVIDHANVLNAFGLADEAATDELLSALAAEDEEEKEPL